MKRPKCPRAPAFIPAAQTSLWIDPNGCTFDAEQSHHAWASEFLGQPDELRALRELTDAGWIRLNSSMGRLNIQLSVQPTPAQLSRLDQYIRFPGAEVDTVEAMYDGKHAYDTNIRTTGGVAAFARMHLREPKAPKSLAGFIDEHGIGEGWQHIWLGPDGEDISVVDHEQYARQQGAGGRNPNIEFERRGWIRVSIVLGSIGFEMETLPTPAQLATMDKYLRYPGIVFKAVNYRNRYIQNDGFTRMTAGRIAAWAQGQAGGGLGATRTHAIPATAVVAHAARIDGTGDPAWVAYLRKEILKYPRWELTFLPLDVLEFDLADDADPETYESALDVPIIVVPDGSNYEVIDGRHRATVAFKLKRKTLPAYHPA